jgi:hypothetical protein
VVALRALVLLRSMESEDLCAETVPLLEQASGGLTATRTDVCDTFDATLRQSSADFGIGIGMYLLPTDLCVLLGARVLHTSMCPWQRPPSDRQLFKTMCRREQ